MYLQLFRMVPVYMDAWSKLSHLKHNIAHLLLSIPVLTALRSHSLEEQWDFIIFQLQDLARPVSNQCICDILKDKAVHAFMAVLYSSIIFIWSSRPLHTDCCAVYKLNQIRKTGSKSSHFSSIHIVSTPNKNESLRGDHAHLQMFQQQLKKPQKFLRNSFQVRAPRLPGKLFS